MKSFQCCQCWPGQKVQILMSHYLFSFGNIWCLISEAEEKEHFVSSEGSPSPLGLLIDSSEASDLWFRCCQNFIQVVPNQKHWAKEVHSETLALLYRLYYNTRKLYKLILYIYTCIEGPSPLSNEFEQWFGFDKQKVTFQNLEKKMRRNTKKLSTRKIELYPDLLVLYSTKRSSSSHNVL